MTSRRKIRWAVVFAAAGLHPGGAAPASTIRDDVPDSAYTALSAQSQYAASGYINANGHGFASATLIAPDWILTAAHAVTVNEIGPAFPASQMTFGLGPIANTFFGPDSVARVIVDPDFNGDTTQGTDLALLQLSTPITNIQPAAIYPGSLGSLLGQMMTLVGYGYTGTGLTGYSTSTLGTRRAYQNIFDALGGDTTTGGPPNNNTYNFSFASPDLLMTDFDQPNNPGASIMGDTSPVALEGAAAPGDSGGGAYVTVNGKTYLAAVTNFVGAFDDNPLSKSTDGHYGDFNGYTNLTAMNPLSFITGNLAVASAWTNSAGGTWASLNNWTAGNPPEFMAATANFAEAISADSIVTLDANWTVGAVTFNNVHSYTLASGSGGTLVLDNGAAAATLTSLVGSHLISAPVVLNSNLIVNAAGALTISGPISGAGSVTTTGLGAVTLSGTNSYAGSTSISGGTLIIAAANAIPSGSALTVGVGGLSAAVQIANGSGTVTVSALTINTGSTVDIGANALAINFALPANDPVATIAAYLIANAIHSSAAAANPNVFAVGYADGNVDTGTAAAANQILVMYTLAGDANLDGSVDFPDLVVLAQNFGRTGIDWAGGNFNYDPSGSVGFPDLVSLAQNFGDSIGSARQLSQLSLSTAWQTAAAVPEPVQISLLAAGIGPLIARRRRRWIQ